MYPKLTNLNKLNVKNTCNNAQEQIHVINADMGDIIDGLRNNKNTAFAHTISRDFNHHRQMTAGVAVTFRRRFGKPRVENCLTKFLAYQEAPDGAAVYSLITKADFWGKPTIEEYDSAFEDLIDDFRRRGFTTMVCSPMGTVRDLIYLDHFARKITEFQRMTGATVLIITCEQRARGVIRHGLPHAVFVRRLRQEIRNAQRPRSEYKEESREEGGRKKKSFIKEFEKGNMSPHKYSKFSKAERNEKDNEDGSSKKKSLKHQNGKSGNPPSQNGIEWNQLEDYDMKTYLDQLVLPKNTLLLDLSVSHFLKKCQEPDVIAEQLRCLDIDNYEYVLAVVNDRESDDSEGGGHWSLLVYVRDSDTFYHLDSLEPLNTKHAEQLAAQISGVSSVGVVPLRCCRQERSVECGAYVLHFCDLVCSLIINQLPVDDERYYNQSFSVDKIYEVINTIKNQSQSKNIVKSKVTLFSDSHGRGLHYLLQRSLGEAGEVMCVVKPNAVLKCVMDGLDYEATKFGSNDHIVILGGTNDIDCNSGYDVNKFRNSIKNLALRTKHTNVHLCTIPLRYDHPNLNIKIRKLNIELIMEALKHDHIHLVNLSGIHVNKYTNHGLHFNIKGKEQLCSSIVRNINSSNLN